MLCILHTLNECLQYSDKSAKDMSESRWSRWNCMRMPKSCPFCQPLWASWCWCHICQLCSRQIVNISQPSLPNLSHKACCFSCPEQQDRRPCHLLILRHKTYDQIWRHLTNQLTQIKQVNRFAKTFPIRPSHQIHKCKTSVSSA